MLTKRYILKSARLQHAYGEARPGFYDHDRSNLSGPNKDNSTIIEQVEVENPTSETDQDFVSFKLEKDPKTGAHQLKV